MRLQKEGYVMSLTAADVLSLPSLRGAEVLAGRGGLGRVVASVSVLEYTSPTALQQDFFRSNEFYGSELVITAFAGIAGDVEAQCANLRRLAQAGEVGLILYYVGVLMKEVSPQLIALADELDFPLICMPRGRLDLQYSEVIGDVMRAIFRDQEENTAINTELLNQISTLPDHLRTVDTVLRMLSDRLHLSLLLLGAKNTVLSAASWPRTIVDELTAAVGTLPLPQPEKDPAWGEIRDALWVSRLPISAGGNSLELLLFSAGGKAPSPAAAAQAGEMVQLAVNLWGGGQEQVAVTELVRAILMDEPMKMRRLAEIFRIDVASIHTMWIIHPLDNGGRDRLHTAIQPVRDLVAGYASTMLCDLYEGDLFLFMDNPASFAEGERLCEALEEMLLELGLQTVITCCNAQSNTSEVRAAFLSNRQNLELARRLFPHRRRYSLDEIDFAGSCGAVLSAGETALAQAAAPLEPLREIKDGGELLHTLVVHLLDCGGSVTRTAKALYLHPNTIKYRLRRVSDLLGRPIDRMPASISLYRAVALKRLLED